MPKYIEIPTCITFTLTSSELVKRGNFQATWSFWLVELSTIFNQIVTVIYPLMHLLIELLHCRGNTLSEWASILDCHTYHVAEQLRPRRACSLVRAFASCIHKVWKKRKVQTKC